MSNLLCNDCPSLNEVSFVLGTLPNIWTPEVDCSWLLIIVPPSVTSFSLSFAATSNLSSDCRA